LDLADVVGLGSGHRLPAGENLGELLRRRSQLFPQSGAPFDQFLRVPARRRLGGGEFCLLLRRRSSWRFSAELGAIDAVGMGNSSPAQRLKATGIARRPCGGRGGLRGDYAETAPGATSTANSVQFRVRLATHDLTLAIERLSCAAVCAAAPRAAK